MLDFTLDEEQAMLERTIRRFAEERLRKNFRDAEEARRLPADIVQGGWEIGVLPSGLPESYGGFGEYSVVTGAVATEAFAWGDLATTLAIMTPNLLAVPVLLEGSASQRDALLPRFCEMRAPSVTAALSEPRIKFDPRRLQTTAQREDGCYVLNGLKAAVPMAQQSELILVYAREGETTQAFLVPSDADGLTVGAQERLMGIHAFPTYGVQLDSVRVAVEARLGEGQGISFDRLLNHSRIALGAAAVGVARAAYEYAREYAKEREQFGEPIAHRQSIAFMLAEMAIDVESMRLLVWEAAWNADQGQDVTREATIMKHFTDSRVVEVADRAVQILGGYGYMREYPVELWLRNARGFSSFDGMAII